MEGDLFVSFHELNQSNLGLNESQVLSNASSCACAESACNKGRNVVALALPSLRPELVGVFEILLGEVVRVGHDGNCSPFLDGQAIEIVVDLGFSLE